VFLPHGTRLRASFGGQNYFARVEGDAIKCGEQVMSPSRFANPRGSGKRNAWKAVRLRLSGSEEWLLAGACRSACKMAIARLLDGTPAQHPRQERRRQPAVQQSAPWQALRGRAPSLSLQSGKFAVPSSR